MANTTIVSYWCQAVFDLYKDSVVRLNLAQRFVGNGFVVFAENNSCLILTCQHVVDMAVGSTVRALFHTGQGFNARVAYIDVDRDLALLRIDGVNVSCTPVIFWEDGDGDVVTGVDVVLLSFFSMNAGVLAQPGTFPGKIGSEPIWSEQTRSGRIMSDYTSMPGTSGAPVFLQRINKVVGVNSGASGSLKISISVQTIQATLREWLQIGDENETIQDMLEMIAAQ